MPGKRKETMDIRETLRHLRRGQSDRAAAEALGIDCKTVARYRTWAEEQELLGTVAVVHAHVCPGRWQRSSGCCGVAA
jgi:hypothetical protein